MNSHKCASFLSIAHLQQQRLTNVNNNVDKNSQWIEFSGFSASSFPVHAGIASLL